MTQAQPRYVKLDYNAVLYYWDGQYVPVFLTFCRDCGVIVGDKKVHDEFHAHLPYEAHLSNY